MSSSSWPPDQPPPYGAPQGPYGPPPGNYGPPPGTYGPLPYPMPPVRPPAPATLILARIVTIALIGAGLLIGLVGGTVLAVPSSMMVTGCSGDTACLGQFFWVAILPFVGCGAGALAGLIGTIVHWRTHWILVWGVIAVGLSVTGILAALRIVGYWPPS